MLKGLNPETICIVKANNFVIKNIGSESDESKAFLVFEEGLREANIFSHFGAVAD